MEVRLRTTNEKWNVEKFNRSFESRDRAINYLKSLVCSIPEAFFGEEFDEEMDNDEIYECCSMCYLTEYGDGYIVLSNESNLKFGTPSEIRAEIA